MNLLKEALKQIIVQSIIAYIGTTAFLGFLAKWIEGTSFFQTLMQKYLFPGWVVLLVFSAIPTIFLIFILKIYLDRNSWKGKKNYISQGLDWNLTQEFFMNSESIPASKANPFYIRDCIIGPFCPICKVDVAQMLDGGGFICLNGHDLKNTEAYRVFDEHRKKILANIWSFDDYLDLIRSKVYAEAQGKVRSGKL